MQSTLVSRSPRDSLKHFEMSYPYLDISDLRNLEKTIEQPPLTEWIYCNLTPKLEIY